MIRFETIAKFCGFKIKDVKRFDILKGHYHIVENIWKTNHSYKDFKNIKIDNSVIDYINIYMKDGSWYDCNYPYYCRWIGKENG